MRIQRFFFWKLPDDIQFYDIDSTFKEQTPRKYLS